MDKKHYSQRDELTEEGKLLWDKMMGQFNEEYNELAEVATVKSKTTRVIKEVIVETDESNRLRMDIKKLMQNSQMVIAECEKDLKMYTKKEQYFKANECRVAILCHTNLITRLQNILDGMPIFQPQPVDNKIHIK